MKFSKIITLFIAIAVSYTGFSQKASKNNAFKIDASQSKVEWLAKKVTGQHNGTINIQSGTLLSKGNKIVGGTFVIDMTSIKVLDLQGEYNAKLLGHLNSDDFFAVDKHKTATLVVTRIAGDKLTGKMTIKGISNDVSFPVTVKASGNNLNASTTIKIDRTKYDIKYGSKSFFESIGDKAIDDEFELKINLVASK